MKSRLMSILIIGSLTSCTYNKEVVMPTFNVTADSTTVSVSDPVTFKFTGDADIITFYSGEPGSEYQYKDRLRVEGGKPQFQFSSLRKYGDNPGVADSTLQLMVSRDFKGDLTVDAIENATWINISDRANIANGASSTAYTNSGVIDLSDLERKDSLGNDSVIYIAFKYHEQKTTATKRAWYTQDYNVDNILPDSSLVNIAGANMGWGTVQVKNTARVWYIYATSSLMWGGAADLPETEDWLISQPLYLDRVPRSLGVIVKNSPTTLQTDYSFKGYSKPGSYTVVFEAIDANRWNKKTIFKTITITVVP